MFTWAHVICHIFSLHFMISISLKMSNMVLVSASTQKCWDFFLMVLSVIFSSKARFKLAAGMYALSSSLTAVNYVSLLQNAMKTLIG